ncbi:cyclohexanecarboxylate-CoA ligase [Actinomadura vinacea]|uniref:Cyclohexanecarboxylate-CoA ligase n=1 Tax=Actinomadura vinacea TaxID=115336 RepID=A0ABP5VSG9_9ACTN
MGPSRLWELVEWRAAATPDAEMAVDERGRRLTFGEYRAAAERAAAGLAAAGARGPGTPGGGTPPIADVSWQLPTWIESLVLVAALARLGLVQNPILPIYREREVGFIAGQARPALLIVPPEWRGFDHPAMARRVAARHPGMKVLVVDGALPEGDPASLPPPLPGGGAAPVRWLFYTSGTTADPKGARHTDAAIMATATGMSERLAMGPGDRNALVFPFTHIGGIVWLFAGLLGGFAHILTEAFDPRGTAEVLRREGVTTAGAGTPFHQAYLAAQRERPGERLFPRLRVCPGGGAPKPPRLHLEVKEELGGAGVASGWGLTECPILSMGSVHDPDWALAGTEGRALPGVDLRVVTSDGRLAGPGEEGELRAMAPQLMAGYADAALDAAAFDAHGYFRTGDLGTIDEHGFVTVTGRLKDVIVRKGENISAPEVENLLFEHPGVRDVAVIGLPDPVLGERCCAVLVPETGRESPSLEELSAWLRERGLMVQKHPERLELVQELPRSPAGKVLKSDLRSRFGAA